MKTKRKPYPTDLTDAQWAEIEPLLRGCRDRRYSKREIINALAYMNRYGVSWRALPHDFPNWQAVESFYRRSLANGQLRECGLTLLPNPA